MRTARNQHEQQAIPLPVIMAALCLISVGKAACAAEQIDQSNLPTWAGGWTHVNPTQDGQATMWQTFRPSRPSMTAVEIDVLTVSPGQGDDTLTVEIAKDGQLLASVDRSVQDGFDGLLRFDFAQPVSLVPEQLYELRVRDTGKTRFGWKYAGNTYDRGSRYVLSRERAGTDWLFQTYSQAEPAGPRLIYVDDDAAGANDGSSWANAYTFLQEALSAANLSEKPVEIRVAQGIYRPNQGLVAIPEFDWRTATFQLINGVTLKGGYAGLAAPDPNPRDFELYETILSGDLNANDVEVVNPFDLLEEPSRTDNSYHVVTGSGTEDSAVLDGFTITAGNANYPRNNYSRVCGGGVYDESGHPTLIDCTFSRNAAKAAGGGMYTFESFPKLVRCTFHENLAERGGGMFNDSRSSPTLTSCTFAENRAGTANFWSAGTGGGMSNSESDPMLTNCVFTGNLAECGGGMHSSQSSPNLIDCVFTGNSASSTAGAVMNERQSQPILIACIFNANSAKYSGGGALNTWESNSLLIDCRFSGNQAGEDGGGLCNWESHATVINCAFIANTTRGSGGGMMLGGHSTTVLTNCTFAGNSASNGNAVACYSYDERWKMPSRIELRNCIMWNGVTEIWSNDSSAIDVIYSNIQGGWPGVGNIDTDSLFASPGYWADANDPSIVVEPNDPNAVWVDGDYHLKSQAGRWNPATQSWVQDDVTSPCIDAGDPNSPVGDEPQPNGGRINMGAYGGTTEASKSYSPWWFATTAGPVVAEEVGIVLPHEHIFTDLRGPTTPGYGQADAVDVVRVMAPLLTDAHRKGIGVLFECSSIGVGRNVSIVAQVAQAAELPVVVPTGVYGRANFAPPQHQAMTEDELTALFIAEIHDGIEGTGIRAGFIKIATGNGPMTTLEEKFLRATGRAARETGAAIASHTPIGSNAVRQTDILQSIDPAIRFVWVHAQNESNRSLHRQLAARGVFIEFDSLGWTPSQDSTFITAIKDLHAAGYADRILLSHDAGWYQPGQPNGGTQKPYTYLIDAFIRKLRNAGLDDATIRLITETNPVRAFGFKPK